MHLFKVDVGLFLISEQEVRQNVWKKNIEWLDILNFAGLC